jgi:single-stranded DNA-binding protein
MSSQNFAHVIGNVAGNPDLKSFKRADGTEGFRTWFRLAVCRNMDRGKEREEQRTSFISIVVWGDAAAKRHAQYIGKGDQVSVYGELVVDSFKQTDGHYHELAAIHTREIEYLRRANKNQTPEQLLASAARLTTRVTEMQASLPDGATAGTVGSPAAESTTGADPFAGDIPAGSVKVG